MKTVFHNPPTETDCTFYSNTTTSTYSIDCQGCDITTVRLGAGLPCQRKTTIPGTSTINVTSCICSGCNYGNNDGCNSTSTYAYPTGPSKRTAERTSTSTFAYDAISSSTLLPTTACPCTSPPPVATCTKSVLGQFQRLSQATCTFWASTSTTTECADCGAGYEGCEVKTWYAGLGPAVHCDTDAYLPVTTSTLTYCTG
ncbi:hypothetical protein EJ03DRAFT_22894 [Teratosphaeria nubilosa]|uniref:Uncharacterized protein n=1 Tax=Teratosphaeria nubilosa TaxID=161662 RepID=A0A6G1LFV6_9PEZI|nr:hypothetical protein EJ03DRAFT_22894 [Teratosphaeria nubilosa]